MTDLDQLTPEQPPQAARQLMLTTVAKGLAAQGWARSVFNCAGMEKPKNAWYGAKRVTWGDTRCAIGHLLIDPDENGCLPQHPYLGQQVPERAVPFFRQALKEWWPRHPGGHRTCMRLMNRMMEAHDESSSPEGMRDALYLVARKFKLKWPEEVA